jgi:AP-3 complex subunit beta
MLTTAASSLSNNGGSYSNDRICTGTGETELTNDLASGGFFHADYKK